MRRPLAFALSALAVGWAAATPAWATLASHRASYDIALAEPSAAPPTSAQTPVGASGLIAYEFRGSDCEGWASDFRQVTQLQRSEGAPLSMKTSAISFEEAGGKSMRFQVESEGAQTTPPVAGTATRDSGDETHVALTKPETRTLDIGHDILFPTQHIEKIIEAAKAGGGVMQARVYDGSDTGSKIFATLTVIGKEATKPSDDTKTSPELAGVRRWPVVVSYFDEASHDGPPEYVLSFDLYENGVSGTLKLDYGLFALTAKLSKLEILPNTSCTK